MNNFSKDYLNILQQLVDENCITKDYFEREKLELEKNPLTKENIKDSIIEKLDELIEDDEKNKMKRWE